MMVVLDLSNSIVLYSGLVKVIRNLQLSIREIKE